MNKRKALLTSIVAVTLGAGAVYAGNKHGDSSEGHGFRGHHGGAHRIGHMLEKMDRHLELSEAQRASIEQILSDNKSQMQQSRVGRMETRLRVMELDPMSANYEQELSLVADQIADTMKAQTKNYGNMVKQVAAVLTPEQRTEARRMIEKRMSKMAQRMEKHQS